MRRVIDLHIHTSVSDGAHAPAEVVELAARAGLTDIAITDHDALDAFPEAAAAGRRLGVRVLPGVEISCEDVTGEVHILGYLVDPESRALRQALARSRHARVGRAQAMLEKLRALGVDIPWQRVQELAGDGSIGRPHIATALREARVVATTQEAFDRFLSRGGPAYVPRLKVETSTAIHLIQEAGGVSVLAHPWGQESVVPKLVGQGLQGLEAYYAGYGDEVRGQLARLARQHGLICTGGSDFHGLELLPERPLGAARVPHSCLEALMARAQQASGRARPA